MSQLFLNGCNIALDLIFAGVFNLGAQGVGIGTAIAEWCTLLFTLHLIKDHIPDLLNIQRKHKQWWLQVLNWHQIQQTLTTNFNLMIRTLFLLFSFALFTNQSAQLGTDILAANHILLQFIAFSAFFLDGFAFTSEHHAGKAIGLKNRAYFTAIIARTTVLAGTSALLLAAVFYLAGNHFIALLTDFEAVQQNAIQFIPITAAYIGISFMAFQLDGIYIGATETRSLRKASIISTLLFFLLLWMLPSNNQNLWIAFTAFIALRALALLAYFPGLMKLFYPASRNTHS